MKNKNRLRTIIRWTARIFGSLMVIIGLTIFGSELVHDLSREPAFSGDSTISIIALLMLHGAYIIGYSIAWKWEGLGGIIAIGGIILSQIISPDPISMFAAQLLFTIPGILYLLYWLLSRSQRKIQGTTDIDNGKSG